MLKGSKPDYYSCNIYYLLFTVSYLNHEVETGMCLKQVIILIYFIIMYNISWKPLCFVYFRDAMYKTGSKSRVHEVNEVILGMTFGPFPL